MLGKRLHFCCTRLKRPSQNNPQQSPNPLCVPSSSDSTSASSLFKNFNSLYDTTAASDSETLTTGFGSGSTSQTLTSTLTADDDDDASSDSEPDLSTVIASGRLLRPASTGRSNSIVEEETGGEGEGSGSGLGSGFGAVPKLSPDPYGDFKRSMEEMVAALGLMEQQEQGDGEGGDHHEHGKQNHQLLCGAQQQQLRLQELLLCYLALNRKNAHKYIVGAFVDILRSLSSAPNN